MVALCSLKQQSNGLQHVLLTASAGSCAKRLPHAKAAAFRTATYESGRQQLVSREARTKSKQAKTVGALRNHLKHCVRERELARIARHSTRPVTSTLLEASIGDLVTAGILRRNCQSGSRRPGGNSVRPQNSLLAGYCERRKERNGSLCCMKEHPKAQQHEEPSPSLVARFFRLFSREQKAVPRPQENGSTTVRTKAHSCRLLSLCVLCSSVQRTSEICTWTAASLGCEK